MLCDVKHQLALLFPVPWAGWAQGAVLSRGLEQVQSENGQPRGHRKAPSLSLWHLCARVCGPDFRVGSERQEAEAEAARPWLQLGLGQGHFCCPLWVKSGPGQVRNLALRAGGEWRGHVAWEQMGCEASWLL